MQYSCDELMRILPYQPDQRVGLTMQVFFSWQRSVSGYFIADGDGNPITDTFLMSIRELSDLDRALWLLPKGQQQETIRPFATKEYSPCRELALTITKQDWLTAILNFANANGLTSEFEVGRGEPVNTLFRLATDLAKMLTWFDEAKNISNSTTREKFITKICELYNQLNWADTRACLYAGKDFSPVLTIVPTSLGHALWLEFGYIIQTHETGASEYVR